MWGCEADGSLFAVSRMPLATDTTPETLIAAWQTAALRNVRAQQTDALVFKPPQPNGGGQVHGVMLRVLGQQPNDQTVQTQLAWFSAEGAVYHLAVYGPQLTPAMLEPFFTEVHWR